MTLTSLQKAATFYMFKFTPEKSFFFFRIAMK